MEGQQHPLVVPIQVSPTGAITPMTARLPGGEKVGVAYTSLEAMQAAQPRHDWVMLGECGLRRMLASVDIHRIQVDPQLVMAFMPGAVRRAVSA